MHLFWRKGYDAATLPELIKAMRLSHGSFYNAFKTKRGVLIRAIHRYMDSGMEGMLAPLGADQAGRAEIEKSFANLVEYTSGPNGRQGCLVGNTMTDLGMRDPQLRTMLLQARSRTEDALTSAVERGQVAGTITRRLEARTLGRFLLNTISGLMVSCKTQPGRAVLEDITTTALRVLD